MASYFNADYYFAAKAKQLSTAEKPWTAAEVQAEFAKQGINAEDHFKTYGASEGLSPNPYFNEKEYLETKLKSLQENAATKAEWTGKSAADLKAAFSATGLTAAEHYEKAGAFETRADGTLLNPSNAFDANAYFAAKLAQLQKAGFDGADTMTVADVVKAVQAAGISPVAHLQTIGATEAKADGIPLVQTVPSEQRVANDPARVATGEIVPSNYNPPSKAPAAAVAAPVTKPADVGGLSAAKPVVPTAPVKVPGDAGYIAPPPTLKDTNEKPVLPPTTTEGTGPNAGFLVVDPKTGTAEVVNPETGEVQGEVKVEVKPDGSITPPAPNAPVVDKDGNNTNDKPVDDTGKPVEPDTPSGGGDGGDSGGGTTPTTLTVKYNEGKTEATLEVTADAKVILSNTDSVYSVKIDGSSSPTALEATVTAIKIGKKVTLTGAAATIAALIINPVVAGTDAGTVEITSGFTASTELNKIDVTNGLTIKVTVDANVTLDNSGNKLHGKISEFAVAEGKTLMGAKAELTGKTVTGTGNVTISDDVASTTDLSKMADSLTITATVGSNLDIKSFTNLGKVDVFDVANTFALTANANQFDASDTIMGSGGVTISGSTGDQTLHVLTLGTNSIAGGKGADTIHLGATEAARAITYTGSDTIKFDGTASVDTKETTAVTFKDITAGQTITVGGLTLTAKQNMAAADVAGVFDSLSAGATTPTETAEFKCTGTLGAWTSGAVSTATVTFTNTVNGNVTDLVVSGGKAFDANVVAPTALVPSVTQEGGANVTETATVKFKALAQNETVIIGGLTLTVNDVAGMTAVEIATAFQSLSNSATGTKPDKGTFSGKLTDWSSAAISNTDEVVFTSATASSNVSDLTATGTGGVTSVTPVQGFAEKVEITDITFGALKAGQSVTVAGLTVKAVADLTAEEVAGAFASKAAAATGTDTNSIDYTGTLTGWAAGVADGAKITFTSTAKVGTDITHSGAGFTAPSATDTSSWIIKTDDGTLATDGSDSQWITADATHNKHDIIMNFDKATDKLQFENVTEAPATTNGDFTLTKGVVTSGSAAFTAASDANGKLVELFKNATVTASNNILAFEAKATSGAGDSLYVVLCDSTTGLGAGDTVVELVGVNAADVATFTNGLTDILS